MKKLLNWIMIALAFIFLIIPALPLMYIYALHRTAVKVLNDSKVL